VPAAAVIPAPIVYIKVVAVKKLVVGSRDGSVGPGSFKGRVKAHRSHPLLSDIYRWRSPTRGVSRVRWGLL